jgi:hypothetical protein
MVEYAPAQVSVESTPRAVLHTLSASAFHRGALL